MSTSKYDKFSDFGDHFLNDKWENNLSAENEKLSIVHETNVEKPKQKLQDEDSKVIAIDETNGEYTDIDVKSIKKEDENDEKLENDEWTTIKSKKKRKSDREKERKTTQDAAEEVEKYKDEKIDKKSEDKLTQEDKLYSWKDGKVKYYKLRLILTNAIFIS